MKLILQKKVPNQEATKLLAKEIFQNFLSPEENFSLFLEGGLGAGKTFFIREVLMHFGVTKEICSPTYVFLNEYQGRERAFAHFDFYRLSSPAEFFARGFGDIAEDRTCSTFVEWPNNISEEANHAFSGKKYVLRLDHGAGVGMRNIKFLEA